MKQELKFMLESLIETNYDENVIKEITTCKIINKCDFGKFVRLQREMMINAYMYEQNGNNKMRDEFTHRAFILSDETAELIGIDKEIFSEILTVLVDKPEFKARELEISNPHIKTIEGATVADLKEAIINLNGLMGVYAKYTHDEVKNTFEVNLKWDHKFNNFSGATAYLGEFTKELAEEYNSPGDLLHMLRKMRQEFSYKIENNIQDY